MPVDLEAVMEKMMAAITAKDEQIKKLLEKMETPQVVTLPEHLNSLVKITFLYTK